MIRQEHPALPCGDEEVQLWRCAGSGRYINLATLHTTTTPPPLASGGLLADDMGLYSLPLTPTHPLVPTPSPAHTQPRQALPCLTESRVRATARGRERKCFFDFYDCPG